MTKQEILDMYASMSDDVGALIKYISDDAQWWIRAPFGVDYTEQSILIHHCSNNSHWQTIEKRDKSGKAYLECSNCQDKPDSDLVALYYLLREQ